MSSPCDSTGSEAKPKSEKDKLKDSFPALCKPDDPMWKVSSYLTAFLPYVEI